MTTHTHEFRYESATCAVSVNGTKAKLLRVHAKTRGQGHATALLKRVMAWVDSNGYSISLVVKSYGHPTQTIMSNDQLIEFYKKFGFELIPGFQDGRTAMIRTKNRPYSEREN
jgi:GNAT superfamily N-acetyltransferase